MAKNWSKRPKICKKIRLTSMAIPRKSVQNKICQEIGQKLVENRPKSYEDPLKRDAIEKKKTIYIYPKLSLKIVSVNKTVMF